MLLIIFPRLVELAELVLWITLEIRYKHPGSFHQIFNKQFVTESARFILEKNNCKFNDEFFVEINSTAGNNVYPYICNIIDSVGYFLSNFYFSSNDSPSKTTKNVFYFIWKALFVLKIFRFLYFCLPLFFSLSAIALEVDAR